jgi:hypothetical protein
MAQYSTTQFANEAKLEPEVVALASRLQEIGKNQARPIVLGISAALSEVAAAANSARAGKPMESKEDRNSLRKELVRSIEHLGPQLSQDAHTALQQLKAELPHWPQLLQDANAARRLEGVVESVREHCESSTAIEAAWTDVLSAFFGAADPDTCELRILQLAEIVDRRSGGWSSLSRTLIAVLMDRLHKISALVDYDLSDKDQEADLAGLPLDDRIALCRQVLTEQPERGDLTVWLAFENARLHQNYLKVGPVEFFAGQVWPDAIREGWPNGSDRIADEFADEEFDLFFGDPPELPFVLTRVALGDSYIGEGIELARQLSQDLIRAAQPGSEWRMMSGGAAFVAGRGWWGSFLQKEQALSFGRFSPEFEPTGDQLGHVGDETAERLRGGDPSLHSAIADIDWAERVGALDDLSQRVALGIRLLERLLPTMPDEHWLTAATRYLSDTWCLMKMEEYVAEVAHNAVNLIEFPAPVIGWKQPWRDRLLPNLGRTYRIELGETVRALPELLDILPPFKLGSRSAQRLTDHMQSNESVLSWKGDLDTEFAVLVERAARQRNEILHGADTSIRVVSSVEPFVGWLQKRLARDALGAARQKTSLAVRLETRRGKVQDRWRKIEEGRDPVDVLFAQTNTQSRS